jgi:ribose 5-phosphate isomerase A
VLVEAGMRLGLGTGSTVMPFLDAIAGVPGLKATASSPMTARRAGELGIALEPLSGRYDLCVDGADQVSPALDLVKGGGGAHVREKLVAALSDRLIIICDGTKLVDVLSGPVPVAILPFASGLYEGSRDGQDDNGLVICDVPAGEILDPPAWDAEMVARPGVVSTGIFPASWVERVIVAADGQARELTRVSG